ncbi:MAG: hypothetical protein K2X50_05460 [Gammaproteobacteria bacterium]|nr:hypothetical protein [Gammaproteobacteria bacterium]
MQMSDEDAILDTLHTELQKCIEEMKSIIDSAQEAQSLKAKDAIQTQKQDYFQENFVAQVPSHIRTKKTFPETIGLRARLLGQKTPPKKRLLSDLNSDDSPARSVHWKSPNKPPFANSLATIQPVARSLEDELEADEPIFEDSSTVSSKSSPEEYSRGHSPTPRQNKSQKVSPRFLSGPDMPASPLGKSPSFNWSQSLGLGSMPRADADSPQKQSSPKTQILQSQPKCELDPLEKTNYLHQELTELNTQYKKIIENEYQQISELLRHSRALLPQEINLDAQQSSLSHWMSEELFNLLSLSCLRQITSLTTRTYIGLETLQQKIKTLDVLQCEDAQLVSIYNQLTASIDNAINEDIQFLKSASNSLENYEMQSKFFTKYFENTENELRVINQLYELVKNDTLVSKEYLEKNPTLVRKMVEESYKFIKAIPETTTRLQYFSTIFPKLINNLVSMTSEYQIEKNNNQQVAQLVF